jgi:hypothetical protein
MSPQQTALKPNLEAVRARRQSLRSAMGAFEAALAMPAAGRIALWSQQLEPTLLALESCVRDHVSATEGPDGFHNDIVTAAPRLHHQVGLLVLDHRRIAELIEQLAPALQHARTEGQVGGIREQGTALLGLLAKHRQRGSDLIYEAYQTDLGGGD